MPDRLSWRAYEVGDAATVAEHHNLLALHAGRSAGVSVGVMESYISAWIRDPASDIRMAAAGDGGLAALGMVSHVPGGSEIGLGGSPGTGRALSGVHPDWRGQGLGRRLLAWQLERATEIHAAADPGAAWEVHVGAPADDDRARRLFQGMGLEPVRDWLEMVAPTTAEVTLPRPADLRIIPYDPSYETSVHAAHMEAFTEHWGSQYRDFARWALVTVRSDALLPGLSRLAVNDGEVVGYTLVYEVDDPERVYLGQTGVRPSWRRRGVASGLLAEVLYAAGRAGKKTVGLIVDTGASGMVRIDRRAGFVTVSRTTTYGTRLPASAG